jgi:hypothetical protein
LALFAAGLGWVLIGQPVQEAARLREETRARTEGAVLVKACLADLRRSYGNTPPLSQAEAQVLQWSDPGPRGERQWSLWGTLRYGQEKGVFDCDGVQAGGGQLTVTYASGSPWWIPPPD